MKTFFMQTKTYNLIALILCAMAFASCSKTDVPKLLEEGKNAFYAADYVKAKEAFEKCAKEDDSQGQFWLAYLTFYTHDSETDSLAMSQEEAKYAFDLYKKSADQNDGDGYFGMAACYMTGYGVTKDESKFIECIDKSAELNSSFGKASKGKRLIDKGGANNIKKGIALIKESAEAGNYFGKTLLGASYLDGTGVPADVNKGLGLLIESANHNDRDANSALARLYYSGMKTIPEDKVKAFKYAEKGVSDGMTHFILSMCYYKGEGTKKG
jgi:TPR repeat protein